MNEPQEVFLLLLSNARHGTERSGKIYSEISQQSQIPEVREVIQARAFVAEKIVEMLEECFKLIGAHPSKTDGRLEEVFLQDLRRELDAIQSPGARALYILAKVSHLQNLRAAEYFALTAAADVTGHNSIAVLLESCLADHLALVERTRAMIRSVLTERVNERLAA